MNLNRTLLLTLCFVLFGSTIRAESPPLGLRVPEGFEITEFAASNLADDIYCMTLDPKGRVIVSGRGYIRLLTGDNDRATGAIEFAKAPKDGAMGLFCENDNLYCMGDGGLWRYRNLSKNGASQAPELLHRFRTGGEHAAHAIRRGPDGWLYVLCGNNTGIKATSDLLATSPIQKPIAGCLLRFPPDFKGYEIAADGFRNAYGFDFNSDGEWFTYDSDNERCVSLPWYEPTRVYHVVAGGHYGWQNPQNAIDWRSPPYFADVVAPIATLGRGSPTGVIAYRHTQFPQAYRDGLFLLDWTFGRVWFVQLRRHGSTYQAKSRLFLEAVGENGFAPTAGAVDPTTGDLYLSIGGRGTRGAVYRIRHTEGFQNLKLADVKNLQPTARSLDWQPVQASAWIETALGTDLHERRKALALLARHFDKLEVKQMTRAIIDNAAHDDRDLRQAAQAVFARLDPAAQSTIIKNSTDPDALTTLFLAQEKPSRAATEHALSILNNTKYAPRLRLDAVRLLQRALGDVMSAKVKGTVWEGYSRRSETTIPEGVAAALRSAFPAHDADLSRELSRTLAMIEDDHYESLVKATQFLQPKSDPIEDVHYLIVAARLRAKRTPEITSRIAESLLALDDKLTQRKMNRDSNWPLRVGETFQELLRKDPALGQVLVGSSEFGRPDHALFARAAGVDRRKAAEIFMARARDHKEFAWNAALIELLGELPASESLPLVRSLWGEYGLDDTILALLARQPEETDRARFIKGLSAPQLNVVRLSLNALEKLKQQNDRNEIMAMIQALRRLPTGKEEDVVAQSLIGYLRKSTGEQKVEQNRSAWTDWFRKKYPDLAKQLGGNDGVDVEAWNRRLATLDWNRGDAERGRALFAKTSCASCHSGAQALGPDLRGVAGRFSRGDLFTAIIQPSKDVSARYRTTQITTAEGKTYQGIIVYEAVDSLMLQTGPSITIRLINQQVVSKRITASSLMPVNLIDRLTDAEIADLYAFLKELK